MQDNIQGYFKIFVKVNEFNGIQFQLLKVLLCLNVMPLLFRK